jgi:hypothetical protein
MDEKVLKEGRGRMGGAENEIVLVVDVVVGGG